MRTVENNGAAKSLHGRDSPIVDHQIRIAEGYPTLGQPDPVVSAVQNLLPGVLHGGRTEELPFLDVDNLPRFGRGHQEAGLPTEKSGNLQDIHVFGRHGCLFVGVNIGGCRHVESFADAPQDTQRFLVADPREAVDPAAVSLTVAALKD